MAKGFTRVRPLAGGFDSWLDAGFAVEDPETILAVRRPDATAG